MIQCRLHRRQSDNLRLDYPFSGLSFGEGYAQVRRKTRQPLFCLSYVVSAQPDEGQPDLQSCRLRVEPGHRLKVDQLLHQRELRH
ncbi:hypothetical protein D3C80_1259580 [compost metagenome]